MSAAVEMLFSAIPAHSNWARHFYASALIFVSLILALPLFAVISSFLIPAPDIWQHLLDTVLKEYILNSLILMLGVGSLTLVLGIVPAWLVTMCHFPLSRTLEWALLLPLAIPAYIIAYTYTGILDASGPVQLFIRELTGWQYGEYVFPEVRSIGGGGSLSCIVFYSPYYPCIPAPL